MGLTPESVSYALDGPRAQRIARLKHIQAELEGWDTEEAAAIRDEADEALRGLMG